MVTQKKLQKYAALAVRVGVNVQKGQLMVLTAPADCACFARMCVEEAYRAGAGEVQVVWTDEQAERLRFEYEGTGTLARVAPWKVEQKRNAVDRKACFLYLDSDTPGLLSHIPGEKLQAANLARRTAMEPFQSYTMANHGQWSIVAIPTVDWAKKVFPDSGPNKALEKLWDAVLMSVRIGEENDPVAEWRVHGETLSANSKKLSEYNFKAMHFQNKLGTDLTLELIESHIWAGGGAEARNGAFFHPNMPTEEVFCMPAKFGVNGTVVATKPLDYQGKLVKDFNLTFRDGKVAAYSARAGEDALTNLLAADDGSAYLGEVALVPHNSPISSSGVLFLNTLFDENASCHLALGAAYPENVKGGGDMTREALIALGSNYSKEHSDFMFGSADMRIEGIRKDGSRVTVFEDGDFNPAAGFTR